MVAPGGNDVSAADREAEAVSLAGELIGEGMKPSAAARELANRLGLARNDAYRIVHDLEGITTDE